mgnify:CR=1 FL=1
MLIWIHCFLVLNFFLRIHKIDLFNKNTVKKFIFRNNPNYLIHFASKNYFRPGSSLDLIWRFPAAIFHVSFARKWKNQKIFKIKNSSLSLSHESHHLQRGSAKRGHIAARGRESGCPRGVEEPSFFGLFL